MRNDQNRYYQSQDISKKKHIITGVVIGSLMFIFLVFLFNLQVVNYFEYERKAREVSLRSEIIPAQRGKIYDRNKDRPLAVNIDSFAISLIPAEVENDQMDALLRSLSDLLQIELQDIRKKVPSRMYNAYRSIEIKNGAGFEQITYIAEHIDDFPGVHWDNKTLRYYNATGSIAHVLGYVGNITSSELQMLYNYGYTNYSVLGKSGIEKQYDMVLRGKDGKQYKTVDARGRRLGQDEIDPPENGKDLVLTIDMRIQDLAEKALGPRKGSVVVLKPSTGEILAMVSYPNFNPNRFQETGEEGFKHLSLSKDHPFLNRAIQSVYPPASTFKTIMTAAILESKAVSPQRTVQCTGTYQVGNREFKCHKKYGHGHLDLEHALAESCNIYFGLIGMEELGIDIIAEYASIFALGNKTNIDLGEESDGVVPTPAWKKETFNTPWTGGDSINTSIGQGFLAVTPLQMANVVAALVNNGTIYTPHVLKEVIDPATGAVIQKYEQNVLKETYLSRETCETVKKYMRTVVTDGTASIVIKNNVVDIAGKTGTGEIGSQERWHSWFISYGPYNSLDPDEQVVVVAMVEASETWEWWAPKTADLIYQGIFGDQTFEEVVRDYTERYIWYIRDVR